MSLVLALLVSGVVAAGGPPVAAADDSTTSEPSSLHTVEPCRLIDTRDAVALRARSSVEIDVAGRCGVSSDAVAVAVTVTAVDPVAPGFLTAYPGGVERPETSVVNYLADDVVANHQFVRLGESGSMRVYSHAATDVVVDVTAYFLPAGESGSTAGRYVPVQQRRLIDTRTTRRPGAGSVVRVDPELPAGATAVAVNVTAAGTLAPGFFTAFAANAARPDTSVLNVARAGQVRAAAAVVPVSEDGLDIFTSGPNHVVVDLLGYFTDDTAPQSTDGLFVAMTPTRLVDTREPAGPAGGPRLWDHGTREFATSAISENAAAFAVNVTLTETEDAGFVTAYPARTPLPTTSTVNTDRAGHTVANFTLVGASSAGIAVNALDATHLVVDVNGWFVGQPEPATGPQLPNEPPTDRRVTIISDSAMAGVRWNGALGGFQGFNAVARLESCRRLVQYSCRGREGYAPRTAASEIETLPMAGPEEILIIAVGYNDWHERFSADFDVVVDTARRRGFHHIVWVDYRSDVGYRLPGSGGTRSNYGEMNRVLGEKLASGLYPEVRRWRFDDYTAGTVGWFTYDGVHETRLGSWGVTDWISRHVRAFDDRPCVQPWTVGGPIEAPCPNPDEVRPARGVPDIGGLYPAALG